VNSGAATCERIRHDNVWCALLAVVLLFLFSGGLLWAQQDERAVRAAFVFNLTKYVSWPHARERLVIGVIGEGNMGPVLKQVLEGKVSDGRPIAVVIHSSDADLRECDLLYVAESSPARIRSILDRVSSRAVLTVGDTEQFTRTGGMVGLVRSGDQIEIEVNLNALRSRQLEMSSRLLKMAVIVSANGGIQ
jgi:hypothetical protein